MIFISYSLTAGSSTLLLERLNLRIVQKKGLNCELDFRNEQVPERLENDPEL